MNLFICATQFKGGSLQVAISLIKEFVKFPENEYYIVVSREVKKQLAGLEFPSNFHFYDLNYPSKIKVVNWILHGPFFAKIEKEAHADCTICTSGPLYWKPKSPLLIGYNLPHLIYPESPYFNRIPLWKKLRWHLRWFIHKHRYHKEASAIFVQTDDVNERLRKVLHFGKVYTISNTYNNAYDNPQKFPEKLTERTEGEFRLLTLSAFYMHKNFEIIPKVIERLKRKGEINIKFVVTLPDNLYEQIFGKDNKDTIVNVGFVPTIEGPSLYNECDAMFLPTLLECFSASYAEAMVMRKPILTSDLGFAHTICKEAAIYFDPDNAEEIAEKIIELRHDITLQNTMKEKGVAQLSQFGTAEDRAKRILELCKQMIIK